MLLFINYTMVAYLLIQLFLIEIVVVKGNECIKNQGKEKKQTNLLYLFLRFSWLEENFTDQQEKYFE